MDDLTASLDKRFAAVGGSIVQYFGDASNNEIHLDTAKLRSLGASLRDVASYLESLGFVAAVYTEDEVREAQARLRDRR